MKIIFSKKEVQYAEDPQKVPVKFSYLEKIDDNTYKQLFPGVICRDFLNDHFLLEGRDIYGFTPIKPPTYKEDKWDYVYLLAEMPENVYIYNKLKGNKFINTIYSTRKRAIFKFVNKNPALTSAITNYIKSSIIPQKSSDDSIKYWKLIKSFWYFLYGLQRPYDIFYELSKLTFTDEYRKHSFGSTNVHHSQGIVSAITTFRRAMRYGFREETLTVENYLMLYPIELRKRYREKFNYSVTIN